MTNEERAARSSCSRSLASRSRWEKKLPQLFLFKNDSPKQEPPRCRREADEEDVERELSMEREEGGREGEREKSE